MPIKQIKHILKRKTARIILEYLLDTDTHREIYWD